MILVVSGSASYYCAELAELQFVLERNGYHQVAATSQYEENRWRKAQSLIVVYYNGTVLLQGADLTTPRTLFSQFLPNQTALPF